MKCSINDIIRKEIIDACDIIDYKSTINLESFYEWYSKLNYNKKDYILRLILADYFKRNMFITFLDREIKTIDDLLLALELNENGILSLYISQLVTFYLETNIDKQDIIETTIVNPIDFNILPETEGCNTYDEYITKIFHGNILDKLVYSRPYDLNTMQEDYNEYIKEYDNNLINSLITDYADRIYSLIDIDKNLFNNISIELLKNYYEWEYFFIKKDSTLGLDDYKLMNSIEKMNKKELIGMCEDYVLLRKLVHNYFETHRIQNNYNYKKVKEYNLKHIDSDIKDKLNYK